MKRNTLVVAAIAFAATTTAIGTAVANFVPALVNTAVFVRNVEATAPTTQVPLISAGTHNLTVVTSGGTNLQVQIDDQRTAPAIDTRTGRNNDDSIIKTSTAVTLTQAQSGVVIP